MASTLEYTDVVPTTPQLCSPVQSGGPVTVSWNDQNVGNQAVSGQYYDLVTITNEDPGNPYEGWIIAQTVVPGDSTLAGNSTSRGKRRLSLPTGARARGTCTWRHRELLRLSVLHEHYRI